MSHLKPIAELESLEEVFDDIVPTQRRPKGVGERSTLTPPPVRVREGEDRHVDMKELMSEPPRLTEESIDPWPLFPPPPQMPNVDVPGMSDARVVVHQSDEWSNDMTPPPLSSDLGSVAPFALSSPPPPLSSELPVHTGWKLATVGLAATLAVGLIAVFIPIDKIANSPSQSLAAAGVVQEPPHISITDLPVVGFVEEKTPKPFTVNEVAIYADIPKRDEPAALDRPAREEAATGTVESSASATTDVEGDEALTNRIEGDEPASEPGVLAPPETLPPFDRGAAASALSAAASAAASCRQPGTPAGTVRVSVTIAPSGRATTAMVSGAFAGTPVGGCIAKTFRAVRVEPFEGNLVTVHKTVTIR